MQQLLQRGNSLDSLANKSISLQATSMQFHRRSKKKAGCCGGGGYGGGSSYRSYAPPPMSSFSKKNPAFDKNSEVDSEAMALIQKMKPTGYWEYEVKQFEKISKKQIPSCDNLEAFSELVVQKIEDIEGEKTFSEVRGEISESEWKDILMTILTILYLIHKVGDKSSALKLVKIKVKSWLSGKIGVYSKSIFGILKDQIKFKK